MTLLQAVAIVLVAVAGTGVAVIADPLRQVILLGIFGLALTMLFFAVQAPDVALSEIVVSTVGLPVMVLLALRKINDQQRDREKDEEQ